jgi:hypothetical protein
MSFCPWCGTPLRPSKARKISLKRGEHRPLRALVLLLGIGLTAAAASVAALALVLLGSSHSAAPHESSPANQGEGAAGGGDAKRIIFLGPQTVTGASSPNYGALFMANSDGSNVTELAPGEEASFVGFGQDGTDAVLYYIGRTPSGDYLLRKRNLATNAVADVLTVEAAGKSNSPPLGTLSADKRYVALAYGEGVDLLDLSIGVRLRILTNDVTGCHVPVDFQRCYWFTDPRWSPDGRRLLVTKVIYESEGARDMIVEPSSSFAEPVSLPDGGASWSLGSDAVCYDEGGSYGGSSEVHVSSAPDWDYHVVVDMDANRRELSNSYVDQCLWVSADQLLLTVEHESQAGSSSYGIAVVRTDGTGLKQIAELPYPLRPSSMFRLDGTRAVLNIYNQSASSYEAPRLLDLGDNTPRPILLKGDFVVAVGTLLTQ